MCCLRSGSPILRREFCNNRLSGGWLTGLGVGLVDECVVSEADRPYCEEKSATTDSQEGGLPGCPLDGGYI